jgi:hypothetical protein
MFLCFWASPPTRSLSFNATETVLRKEHAEPVLENLGKWLEEKQYSYNRPKNPMGQTI